MNKGKLMFHFGFWLVYLAFKTYHEFVWIYPKYENLDLFGSFKIALLAQSSILPHKIIFTYWVLHLLLDGKSKILLPKWFQIFVGFILTLFLFRLTIIYFALPFIYQEIPEKQSLFSIQYLTSATIDITLVVGLATALLAYQKYIFAERHKAEIQQEKLATELQFLRHQLNPHFLFNTLNNLYGLARKQSTQTPQAILKLAQLMRFMLYDAKETFVTLEKELEVLESYLQLERLRYGNRLKLEKNIVVESNNCQIAPLLLLTLVENAFKHGVSESYETPWVQILLLVKQDKLDLKVSNRVNDTVEFHQDGIGLTNLKRQLILQYPEHELTFHQEKSIFNVHLKIKLCV